MVESLHSGMDGIKTTQSPSYYWYIFYFYFMFFIFIVVVVVAAIISSDHSQHIIVKTSQTIPDQTRTWSGPSQNNNWKENRTKQQCFSKKNLKMPTKMPKSLSFLEFYICVLLLFSWFLFASAKKPFSVSLILFRCIRPVPSFVWVHSSVRFSSELWFGSVRFTFPFINGFLHFL